VRLEDADGALALEEELALVVHGQLPPARLQLLPVPAAVDDGGRGGWHGAGIHHHSTRLAESQGIDRRGGEDLHGRIDEARGRIEW
jgi:hypothetical protein